MAVTVLCYYLFTKRPGLTFISRCSGTLSKFAKERQYEKCYKVLGISEDSDQEQIRTAYLTLVKKYHPDSGSAEANAEKFQEIDRAFRILIDKKSKERWDVEELVIQEQDIRHTAPQHRQYLSYDGIGSGTPYQRQKQYRQARAVQAASNVMQHRISKVTASEHALWDKSVSKHKHNIKTKYGLERLVEDLIQESMSKGEFNNLSGCGKPLRKQDSKNPYVDFTTHKINEVLIDNGFVPEWISLQKEIREEMAILRDGLILERSYFGPLPFDKKDEDLWTDSINKYEKLVATINSKINKYNLVVPILHKQMVHVNLEKEAKKALLAGEYCSEEVRRREIKKRGEAKAQSTVEQHTFFDILYALFKS